MDTAAAGQYDCTLAFHQTFRAVLGVTEGYASARHQVEVVLQLGWDVEVVHWGVDDDDVMRLQLSNQLVGQGQRFLLTRAQRCIAWAQRANQLAIKHRNGVCSQVTHGDFVSRMLFTPLFNEVIRQLTRLRVPCQNAGFQN